MKKKIFLYLLVLFFLFSSGIVLATFYIKNTTDELNRLITLHRIKGMRQNLIIGIHSAQSDLYTVNTSMGQGLDKIVANIANLDTVIDSCSGCHHDAVVEKKIVGVKKQIAEYENAMSYYITAAANQERIETLKLEAAAKGNRLLFDLEEMSFQAGEKLESSTAGAMIKIGRARAILYLTIVLAFIAAVTIALNLTSAVTGPINKLVAATRRIAEGELGVTAPVEEKNEFGELADHFNRMSSSLQEGYARLESEIDAHKKAEDALAKSEHFLTTVFDSIRDPFCIFDRNYDIVKLNESYADIKHREPRELIGRTCYSVLHDRSGICDDCIIRATFMSGHPCAKEKPLVTAEGRQRWEEIYTYPVFGDDGLVSHVIEYTRDITSRKLAEKELRESKERYELAARGANDGLWDWDLVSGRIYYSPRWKGMLGYDEAEIGDSAEEWFGRVHPDDREQLMTQISAHINGHSTHLENEHRVVYKGKTYRWMLTRGLAVRDGEGKAYRMAGSQTDITERKMAEAQLLHDAFHDALTGLPNRALFMDRLSQEIRSVQRHGNYNYAVLFIDVDRFKVVNDSLGHLVGDKLLVSVGQRLLKCIRPDDTVARLGGDEFAVLLKDIKENGHASFVADRILSEIKHSFTIKGQEIFTSASIGIAYRAHDHLKPEHILRDADIAMYQAKAKGKGCYVVFEPSMHRMTVERMKLETDLRRAVETGRFLVHYQPIVNLEDHKIVGFEALVRWLHPERGVVMPMEFIPLAEETGLILPIGEWILRESCRQVRLWQQAYPSDPPLKLSVNISSRQLADPLLVDMVIRTLEETGFEPDCLALEITESLLIDNTELAIDMMERLQGHGIHIHIDDFGTGYSSLSYLHRYPVNALKIDRSFVNRLNGDEDEGIEIVRTILSLAKTLNLDVIAEGLEFSEQLSHFRDLRCRYGQGFLFSKPMAPESVPGLFTGTGQITI